MAGADGTFGPLTGQRCDIPQPRARTPSPLRKAIATQGNLPSVAREFDIDIKSIDIIYAEDEEVFRETAVRELLKAGFVKENIHESENGLGALEDLAKLQTTGHQSSPLVVLLDVRMPGMDGRECALQIQELVKKKVLRREPFVMCISSIHRQVIVEEGKGNFQIVLPKPFNLQMINESLDLLRKWWTMGYGRQLPAWKTFDAEKLDIIAADDEPVCRMSAVMAFTQAGVNSEAVSEAEQEEELHELLNEAQEGDGTRPLIILLGTAAWAAEVRARVEAMPATRRDPFVVCTSVDSERLSNSAAIKNFHAFLPRSFSQGDVKWCLELCRLWWLTRGDGPSNQHEDDSGSDCSEESEMST